ncbi:tetratricopeptide repeat protein [Fulvivirga sp. 29W222]|uniref:histidine kinase n=1 Tax=Fulvivirga marina TaxID=2494733 RepID=A0A937FT98_9BACT|nr:tetratricopeptide repeat protein [Fulvivirga marina]
MESNIYREEKVDTYLNIATEYLLYDSLKTLEYVNKAFNEAVEVGYETGKIDALNTKALLKIKLGKYEQAKEICDTILVLSMQENYSKGKAKAYKGLGAVSFYQGDYQQALNHTYTRLKINQELKDSLAIQDCYYSLGLMYRRQGNHEKSLENLFLSLEIIKKLGLKNNSASNYNSIGLVYMYRGNHQLALKYYLKAFEICEEFGDTKVKPEVLNNIGVVYEEEKKYEMALDYYLRSLQTFKKLGSKREIALSLHNIGNIYEKQGLYDKSLEYQLQSLALFEVTEVKVERTYPLLAIGRVYRKQNLLLEARRFLSDALQISQETGFKLNIKNAAHQLALVEEALENYKAAYNYHVLFKQMSDSLINEDNTEAITKMQTEYEFDQERDSIQFANEKEKLVLSQKIQSQQNKQYVTIVGIIILIVLLYILYRYYLSKQKANKLLQQRNEEIDRQKRELESLDHIKSRFFANISHELRTPLTLISAPISSLTKRDLPEEAVQELNFISNNTSKLQSLVDDILQLSKLESHKIEVKSENVAIASLLTRIFSNFSSMAVYLEITYESDIDFLPDDYLRIDAPKLEKVLNNLISNALKYTLSGGCIQMKAYKQCDLLCIQVKDTGKGIIEEDLPYIFDPYFQSKQPDAPMQGGTGIGLALAKEYADLMGGELTVKSQQGRGSTFSLTIPYEEGVATQIPNVDTDEIDMSDDGLENDLPIVRETGDKYRVLIVEDHPEMLQFIKSMLQEKYAVFTAFNGKHALMQLEKEPVDLIISDVMMPEMDGFTLLQTIREDEKNHSVPMIMLTALNEEDHKLKALNIGVDEYLPKPFSLDELMARVKNMLLRHEVRKQVSLEEKFERQALQERLIGVEGANKGDSSFIMQVEELILAELENEEFRLDNMAEVFHIGKRQFRRRLKKVTGLSPKEYQREVAMQKARKLLEDGVYNNLSAVAFSSGIRNTTRFAQYYKNRFGKDPREYFQEFR